MFGGGGHRRKRFSPSFWKNSNAASTRFLALSTLSLPSSHGLRRSRHARAEEHKEPAHQQSGVTGTRVHAVLCASLTGSAWRRRTGRCLPSGTCATRRRRNGTTRPWFCPGSPAHARLRVQCTVRTRRVVDAVGFLGTSERPAHLVGVVVLKRHVRRLAVRIILHSHARALTASTETKSTQHLPLRRR